MNKKGQSLIEVTVALTILSVVMMGILALGINVIGYTIFTKGRTQAIALAQQGLEETRNRGGCGLTADPTPSYANLPAPFGDFSRRVIVRNATNAEASGLNGSDFWFIQSEVRMNMPGVPAGETIS